MQYFVTEPLSMDRDKYLHKPEYTDGLLIQLIGLNLKKHNSLLL